MRHSRSDIKARQVKGEQQDSLVDLQNQYNHSFTVGSNASCSHQCVLRLFVLSKTAAKSAVNSCH